MDLGAAISLTGKSLQEHSGYSRRKLQLLSVTETQGKPKSTTSQRKDGMRGHETLGGVVDQVVDEEIDEMEISSSVKVKASGQYPHVSFIPDLWADLRQERGKF